jgi:pimeloyl-ACP methyl ester carboxylesterase
VSVIAERLTRWREGTGSPLVLLHGLGLSRRSWRPVLGRLAARHDVLALDLPGFGAVPPLADSPPSVAALTDAVERELDGLGLREVALAGNSLGGSVALELARRGRATRVTVLGPSGMESAPERALVIALNETQRAMYRAAAPAAGLVAANPATRGALLAWLHGRPWRVSADDAAEEIRDFAGAPGFHATLRRATSVWSPADLREVRVPVRVCTGTRDLVIGAISGPRLAAAIPGARAVRLAGCGHVPMADDPDAVAGVIATWEE